MLEKKTQPESFVNTANVDKAKHSDDTKMSFPKDTLLAFEQNGTSSRLPFLFTLGLIYHAEASSTEMTNS